MNGAGVMQEAGEMAGQAAAVSHEVADISPLGMTAAYLLLIIPLAIILWKRIGLLRGAIVSVLRMSVQLLFVGLYLQVIFRLNNPWLNAGWVLLMIAVADVSIARGCDLRVGRIALPLFFALLTGTAIPLAVFVGLIVRRPMLLDAQYVIPIGGMILGNCLRADIVGIRTFFDSIRKGEKAYANSLAQGAGQAEALEPYTREATRAALAPTIATIATIGLVALPGMMTGVILGGAAPMTAIKYQIAIMIAIFSGTASTVYLALRFAANTTFNDYGLLDHGIFKGRDE